MAAVCMWGAAVALWHREEPGAAAFIVPFVALMAFSSVVTLAVPAWPRLFGGLAAVGGGSAPASARSAASHGRHNAAGMNGVACILAATLGTLPVALLGAALLGQRLPVSADLRFALAFVLAIPLWVASMCVGFLVRSGLRAWAYCIGISLALGGLVFWR